MSVRDYFIYREQLLKTNYNVYWYFCLHISWNVNTINLTMATGLTTIPKQMRIYINQMEYLISSSVSFENIRLP